MRVSLPPAKIALICAVLASSAGLTACDTMQSAMGIGKLPPDEYAVAPRRPLAMPPDYDLRAPQPGAAAPADINASGIAARALATTGQAAGPAAPVEPPAKLPPAPASTPTTDAAGRVLTTTPP